VNARGVAVAAATLIAVVMLGIEISTWSRSARLDSTTEHLTRCSLEVTAVTPAYRGSGLRVGGVLWLPPLNVPARTEIVYHYTHTQ